MNAAQEKLGRRLADAFRQLEWTSAIARDGVGGARVEVRHPMAERDGVKWLVATVSIEEREPQLTYVVPQYRALERVVKSVAEKVRNAPKRRVKGGAR